MRTLLAPPQLPPPLAPTAVGSLERESGSGNGAYHLHGCSSSTIPYSSHKTSLAGPEDCLVAPAARVHLAGISDTNPPCIGESRSRVVAAKVSTFKTIPCLEGRLCRSRTATVMKGINVFSDTPSQLSFQTSSTATADKTPSGCLTGRHRSLSFYVMSSTLWILRGTRSFQVQVYICVV